MTLSAVPSTALRRPYAPAQPNVAFVVDALHSEASGVTRVVCDLANSLARRDAPVTIYTANCNGRAPARHLLALPERCQAHPAVSLSRLTYSPQLRNVLEQDMPHIDLVHNHSLWTLPNHYASQLAHRHRKPVLFTAHGALEPWALRWSGWKKKLAAALFQRRDLRRAACLHALNPAELQGLRQFGLRNPVAVIPNGVDLAPLTDLPPAVEFENAHPETRGKRIALFLSRLHPKKGLALLVQAWSRLAPRHPDWHLVIAGPDDGHESELRRLVRELALDRSVTFTGILCGQRKLAALSAATLFVLPSHSEGFSMAVLEALGSALPVLLTPHCNFPQLAAVGAGIEVQPTVDAVERGLCRLLQLPTADLARMGSRGRALVERSYTWDQVAVQMQSLYAWLTGGGSRPAFVEPAHG